MIAALIADLEAAGARLSIRDGALAVTGPRVIFTLELRARIEAQQAELLAALAEDSESTKSTEATDAPAVQSIGTGVLVTGLDNAGRHRVLCAIASHHWPKVWRVATRHDYKGGALSVAAEDPAVAARAAQLARRALELPEPNEATNGEEPCGLK